MKLLGKKTYPPVGGQTTFPTPELRYRKNRGELGYGEKKRVLQQKWVNPTTGEDIWKDIPTV